MIKRFQSSRIVLPDGLFDGFVYVQNGSITAVTAEDLPCDQTVDVGDNYLSPGFVDLHVHGGVGHDFGTCDAAGAAKAADYHLSHGTTTLLPTLAAAPIEDMAAAVERLKGCAALTRAHIPGVHLEGPYFSPAQCGAQNTAFITAPIEKDYAALLEKHGDFIKRWSYAPERDENGAFCKALAACGVLPAAGHPDAVAEDMQTAFENGCKLITHLYSCTSTVTREKGYRRLGVIEYAYLNDAVTAEIIADGAHLPPDLIRMIVKIKGRDRVALVTDALSAAGLDATTGQLNGVPYIVEDCVCKLIDRSAFAGSIATTDRLIRICVQKAGFSVVGSVYMASTVPAQLLSLQTGRIRVGYAADLVVFDDDIQMQAVYVNGEKV